LTIQSFTNLRLWNSGSNQTKFGGHNHW